MDEILDKFNTLATARPEDDHKDLYKNWGKYGNQEERRIEILRQQKSNRENKLDNFRGIINLMKSVESSAFKKSSRVKYQPNVYVPGFTSTSNSRYNNVLMNSEWLVEKPEDFATNWFVTPCPKGTRALVVACHGTTKCYTKYGQLILTTTTLLPGGNGNEKWKSCSVLDCFYCKDINTLYVLDLVSWNNHLMTDGEMEFRRYWLETTFKENPEYENVTKKNKVSLKLLPMISCDPDSIQNFMMTYPPLTSGNLDGLLFYHRHGHYVAGETPLVGWLYPYMVPEVLCPGMTIHESYAAQKPGDYVDQATFIQIFEEISTKRKNKFMRGKKERQRKFETSMDAEDGQVEQDNSGENEMIVQNVVENASMDAENIENEENQAENEVNEVENIENVDNQLSDQVPLQFTGLFSNQNPTQQLAKITK